MNFIYRTALSLLPVLGLSACFDADLAFDLSRETARMEWSMSSQLLAMAGEGKDPREGCEANGGIYTLTAEAGRCTLETRFFREDWIDQGRIVLAEGDMPLPTREDGLPLAIERSGFKTLRITLDTQEFLKDAPGMEGGEEDIPEGMKPLFMAGIAGHGLSFTFTGRSVRQTNGAVSADGRSATFFIPLSDVMEGPENRQVPPLYEAEIRY
ncbi:hypothetical protein [Celeribacter indicus]|uniref:Lipoprotein n=1 Tax=Celeribacter indicus TaxID=1208324 RepID=A0A0B5DV15_9RHOB|nr:hypothetical protein [Celeribacter indicus]AJE47243.1 hypothetical protein P73_2528 [Celeribacter indicus]SDW01459.1 hypothetical protein SAMN05443573_10180 [Celeribacter indicus]